MVKNHLMNNRLSTILCLACLGLTLLSPLKAQAASLGKWAKIPPATTEDIKGLAFGNNTYVAVGTKGYIATSSDGVKWSKKSAGITRDFNGVTFSQGRFIAVCKAPDDGPGAKIWISDTNGSSWKYRDTDVGGDAITQGLHSVSSNGNGILVAVGGGWAGQVTVSYDNGTSWHRRTGSWSPFYGVIYAREQWIAVGSGNPIRSTDGGVTWNTFAGPDGFKIAYGGECFVVAPNNSTGIKWSSDGVTWRSAVRASQFTSDSIGWTSGCIYADGMFVVTEEYSRNIWVSENGRVFKKWESPGTASPYLLTVAYANRTYLCGGYDGQLCVSPPWLKARMGSSWDYPFTFFDAEDGLPQRIGLPQYRVNTASLNLVLEATLFYMRTLCTPVNLRLVYNSQATEDADVTGLFGKNWHFRYETAVGQFGPEAQVVTGGGRSLTYTTPDGSNLENASSTVTLLPPTGGHDTLQFIPGTGFDLTEKDSKLTYRYGQSGGPGNAIWRLTRITDRSGNQMLFSVGADSGKINSITDPAGRGVTFLYNGDNLCTRITAPDGRFITFQYDSHKNLISMTDMAGYVGSYTYDEKGFLKRMNTAGRVNRFTWVNRPGSEKTTDIPEADEDMILASVTNSVGGVVKYELLPKDGGVKRTDTRGEAMVFKSKDGQTSSITDPLGAVRSIDYSDGKLPASFTDDLGKVVKFDYDDHGNLTSFTDAVGNETQMEYDANDNLIERTNPLGKKWTYAYDANHRLTSVKTPLLNESVMTYYPNGRLTTNQDARGNSTSFTYDAFGNLASVTDPLGKTIFRAYDAQGLRCTLLTDQRGKTKELAYDNNDRLLNVKYDSAPGSPERSNTFNAFGQTEFTDEFDNTTVIMRDDFGYVTSVTDALGHVANTEYDPNHNPVRRIDALGRMVTTTYDDLNRPLVITDARGKQSARAYDDAGNLTAFTDEKKSKTQYTYDGNQRLLSTTDALGKKTTLTRDKMGRVELQTNARGHQIRHTYDDDGRLTKKEVQTTLAEGFVEVATYAYDANGNLTSRSDAWGAMTWVYNANNRTSSVSYPTGKSASFTYNDAGLIETTTYPNGLVVSLTYDDFNRQALPRMFRANPQTEFFGMAEKPNQVTKVTLAKDAITRDITMTHDAAGRVMTINRPGLVTTSFTYDELGRGLSIIHQSNSTDLINGGYTYDAVGNLLREAATGPHFMAPPLPEVGIQKFNAANGLTAFGNRTAVNDADGNLTSIANNLFTAKWDAENRLTEFTRDGENGLETVKYTYDAAGLRVKRQIVGGATTHYHYGPGGLLLFTTDDAGTVTASFVWSGRALIAMILGDSLSTQVAYPLLNRLGSVTALTDASGNAVARYSYDSYGTLLRETVPPGGIDLNPFTFAGGYGVMDEGEGLYYMKERFYFAKSGRFLQRDPIGLAGGTNLYAYAAGNPVINADPEGKAWWMVVPVALAAWSWYSAADNAAQAGQEAGRAVESAAETQRAADRTVASHQRFRDNEARAMDQNLDADARIRAAYESRDAFNQMWNHDAPATADAARDTAYHSARAVYRSGKAVGDAFGGVAVSAPKTCADAMEQVGEKIYEETRDNVMENATGLGDEE